MYVFVLFGGGMDAIGEQASSVQSEESEMDISSLKPRGGPSQPFEAAGTAASGRCTRLILVPSCGKYPREL